MYSLVEITILNAIAAGVLALVVLLLSRLLRRPALLHALWVLVLLKLVTPPIIEIPIGLKLERLASLTESDRSETLQDDSKSRNVTAPPAIVVKPSVLAMPGPSESADDRSPASAPSRMIESNQLEGEATSPSSLRFRSWVALAIPAVLCLWAAGTVAWFLVQTWRIALFARLASTARLASKDIQRQAARLASSIGARRAPQILVLDATMSPILWSMGSRTRVIFPAGLLDRVDKDARATLLTHELAHYHRGDHWVRLLEFVVTGLFWWHPAVWIARREIEVTEEHCCDAWVVTQFPDQPRCYAEALLDTIDFLSEARTLVAPVATGLGQVPFLRERIRLIMSGVAPKSMSGTTRLAVLAAAAVLLPLGPQLFDGAIRHADAALEPLDLNTFTDVTQSTIPEEADTETTHAAATANPRIESARKLLEGFEDDLTGLATVEVRAWAVVNSPDGRFRVVANAGGGLVLSDTFQRRAFDLGEYQISSIAFVPHRDLLAAGSSDSTVYLIDCASGEPIATFAGHEAAVGSVAVSLDGRYVASGSRDGAVKLWDIDYERELPSRISNHSSAINCVRFSADGRLLAIATGDWLVAEEGTVELWDLRGGTTKQRLNTGSPVGAIAFGDGQLVAAEWNGRTTAWDLRSGTATASALVSKDTVSAASFAADAQSLLLAAADGEQSPATIPAWFQRMDRDRDGQLAWNEFQGPRGTFRKLDADADEVVTRDELGATIQ